MCIYVCVCMCMYVYVYMCMYMCIYKKCIFCIKIALNLPVIPPKCKNMHFFSTFAQKPKNWGNCR